MQSRILKGSHRIHDYSLTPDEVRAEALAKQILQLAQTADVDSSVFVAAMADALGITAATLDQEVSKQALEERLHEFCGRVESKYVQVIAVMEQRKWNPRN